MRLFKQRPRPKLRKKRERSPKSSQRSTLPRWPKVASKSLTKLEVLQRPMAREVAEVEEVVQTEEEEEPPEVEKAELTSDQ